MTLFVVALLRFLMLVHANEACNYILIPSDRSTSRPTSLGALSSHSKFNVNNSRNHSISSENAQIIAQEKSIILNNQPPTNLLTDSQEKLSKMSLDLSSNKPPTCIFTPNSDVASSPEDDSTSLGTVEFALRYDPEAQTLSAVIIRAKNLKAMDSNGFSDPYVKLHLLPDSSKSTKLRTRTVRRSLNPEWNEQLVYYGVTEDDRLKKTFLLTVLDEDRFGSDFIGETRVPLKRLTVGREKLFNVYLEKQRPIEKIEEGNEERGKILLSLKYNTTRQVLIVGVIRCVQLTGMDASGYSDPYVKM
uniref:C2 domain-containing protein n=1 Tax=Romanomermis culicivorax TaxID=13658 RepID=A0A915IXP2_ROMCU